MFYIFLFFFFCNWWWWWGSGKQARIQGESAKKGPFMTTKWAQNV